MKRLPGLSIMILCAVLVVIAAIAFVVLSYYLAPRSNTSQQHFDTLLVLGAPSAEDGSVELEQKWRMDEAIREYHRGVADHLIVSGGAVFNRFVEAQTMARYALQGGVPAHAIVEETASRNTLENVFHSERIMEAQHWRSVEVISSPEHLARAAVLLQYTPLLWCTHAAPTPGRQSGDILRHTVAEALATAALRVFGLRITPVLHRLKVRFGP